MQGVPMKVATSGLTWGPQCPAAACSPFRGLVFRPPPGLTLETDSRRSSSSSASGIGIRPPPGLDFEGKEIGRVPSNASTSAPSDDGASISEGSSSRGCRPAREQRTTLHVRNVPCYFTRASFLQLIDSQGCAGQYDFVYLPMDFKTRQSLGYAFVNFRTTAAALLFRAAMDGFSRWPIHSRKVCSIQWSQTQGLEKNVQLVLNSDVMKKTGVPEEFKPAMFVDGQIAYFPATAKKFPLGPKHSQISPFPTAHDSIANFW